MCWPSRGSAQSWLTFGPMKRESLTFHVVEFDHEQQEIIYDFWSYPGSNLLHFERCLSCWIISLRDLAEALGHLALKAGEKGISWAEKYIFLPNVIIYNSQFPDIHTSTLTSRCVIATALRFWSSLPRYDLLCLSKRYKKLAWCKDHPRFIWSQVYDPDQNRVESFLEKISRS